MFRLYVGLKRDKWYNYAEIQELKGGNLAVLKNYDNSGGSMMKKFVFGCMPKLYTESGEEYEMTEKDAGDIKIVDVWKIGMEVMKQFAGQEKPVFDEFFYCSVCSTLKNERYTLVRENWSDLIEHGIVDEIFLNDYDDCRWWTELPKGLEIEGSGTLASGTFTRIQQELLSIDQLITIQNTPGRLDTDADYVYSVWDEQICHIEGFTDRDLTVYVKRDKKKSFSEKYFKHQADIDAMYDAKLKVGLEDQFRSVECRHCKNEIGGRLDFTNFFGFLFPSPSTRRDRKVI